MNEEKPVKKPIFKKNAKGNLARLDEVAVGDDESRLDKFIFEFQRNGGSATQAAVALGYSKESAVSVGGQYLSRAKQLGLVRSLAEDQMGLQKLLALIIQKAYTTDNPAYLDRLIKVLGFEEEFLPTKQANNAPSVVNIIQTQKNLQNEFGFVEGQVVKEKDDGK
jgi:hypothetical protein